MGTIRPETEVDRTEQALAAAKLRLPLARGQVEIEVGRAAAESAVGQRLITLLVNELARMKGVVSCIYVVGLTSSVERHPSVPLRGGELMDGLGVLVDGLNRPASSYRAAIAFDGAPDPHARVRIGQPAGSGLLVGADAWRALLGHWVEFSDWAATAPYGAALAASLAAAEVFKQLVKVNSGESAGRVLADQFAFSAFNFGIDGDAAAGPDVFDLEVGDIAVVGCGAGGTAALYVLGMQPGLSGHINLVEPGRHKSSNLNRYLMTTAHDVQVENHKLGTLSNHLAINAPLLRSTLQPVSFELVDSPDWSLVLSTVDTVEARWNIQRRLPSSSLILDAAVRDLEAVMMRVVPGGRCLECVHPYDAELPLKYRAQRWGVEVEEIRRWTAENVVVTREMVDRLARIQNRDSADYEALVGIRFGEVPNLTECGETPLRTDIPSQAPVLPIATTHVGVLLAAEIAKHFKFRESALSNWLAHNLAAGPNRPIVKWRPPVASCPRHRA
jgi:hypothetical protein